MKASWQGEAVHFQRLGGRSPGTFYLVRLRTPKVYALHIQHLALLESCQVRRVLLHCVQICHEQLTTVKVAQLAAIGARFLWEIGTCSLSKHGLESKAAVLEGSHSRPLCGAGAGDWAWPAPNQVGCCWEQPAAEVSLVHEPHLLSCQESLPQARRILHVSRAAVLAAQRWSAASGAHAEAIALHWVSSRGQQLP